MEGCFVNGEGTEPSCQQESSFPGSINQHRNQRSNNTNILNIHSFCHVKRSAPDPSLPFHTSPMRRSWPHLLKLDCAQHAQEECLRLCCQRGVGDKELEFDHLASQQVPYHSISSEFISHQGNWLGFQVVFHRNCPRNCTHVCSPPIELVNQAQQHYQSRRGFRWRCPDLPRHLRTRAIESTASPAPKAFSDDDDDAPCEPVGCRASE